MPWANARRPQPGNWKYLKAKILRDHAGVCHLCGHPGAAQVDHIIPVKLWLERHITGSPHHPSNLAPAHATACPVCGRRCHIDKTQAEARAGKARARANLRRNREPHPGARRDRLA
jgi:5-methylcytosine-specific restriction endonuclease McrA